MKIPEFVPEKFAKSKITLNSLIKKHTSRLSYRMKLHVKYAIFCLAIASLWIWLKLNRDTFGSEKAAWFIDVSPLYLVMAFGSYCLFKLGYDILTFNNYPAEIGKLAKVIIVFIEIIQVLN